jgi:hypothetical protein
MRVRPDTFVGGYKSEGVVSRRRHNDAISWILMKASGQFDGLHRNLDVDR